jgi:hypothetical protein
VIEEHANLSFHELLQQVKDKGKSELVFQPLECDDKKRTGVLLRLDRG